ncbi:nSTAND1 domain-containing NTPase [Flagellimonas sp. 2504JD4-2]
MSDNNRRYPGARPFKNNPLERKLFFGRENEKKQLLHLILSKNLVVLFAKSGVGKSSLLNAGVFEQLSDRGYFPVPIRLYDPSEEILDSIESFIADEANKEGVEFISGSKNSLREFLKTSELWTEDDKLLTPVLVFDQFEEIFTLGYEKERRKAFFEEISKLEGVKYIKSGDDEAIGSKYQLESPPKVKIVLSFREEFLAEIEEIAENVPGILSNRFRLTEMTKEQARLAIEEPARISHEELFTPKFTYSEGAIKSVIDFLIKRDYRQRLKSITYSLKWSWQVLLTFAVAILLLTAISNYLLEDGKDIGAIAILYVIIPLFVFILVVRKPIATRHTIGPIVLLYAWFLALAYSLNVLSDYERVELLILFLIPVVVVNVVVFLSGLCYKKGRDGILSDKDGADRKEMDTLTKWPLRYHIFFMLWLIISMSIGAFLDWMLEIIAINILIVMVYFVVLQFKFTIHPKKTLLPIFVIHLFNLLLGLILVNGGFGDLDLSALAGILFLTFILFVGNVILAILFWMSYNNGKKSTGSEELKITKHSTPTIAPFQLQLLCQSIEDKVLLKHQRIPRNKLITITKKDFGGSIGMLSILLNFYDNQIKKLNWIKRPSVRKLCEQGLISQSGKRLSVAEAEIKNRYNIDQKTLSNLVDFHLLRFERRLEERYYEISHDTLVHPILTSSQKNIFRDSVLKWGGVLFGVFILANVFSFYDTVIKPSDKLIYERINQILESDNETVENKIMLLETELEVLNKRINSKKIGIIHEDENDNSSDSYYYNLNYGTNKRDSVKVRLDSLIAKDSILLELNDLKFIDETNKEIVWDSIPSGTKSIKLSVSTPKNKTSRLHLVQIQLLTKETYWGNHTPLEHIDYSIYTGSVQKDTILSGLVINEQKGFSVKEMSFSKNNQLRFYELDPKDKSVKFLLGIYDFSLLPEITKEEEIERQEEAKESKQIKLKLPRGTKSDLLKPDK